jgi:hypothetical protein
MIAALIGLALAQEPEPVDEVIIVYGEERVRAAREAVIRDLEGMGYTKLRERDGRLVMLHETTWKGKVTLHDDGFVEFSRQGVKGTMPDTFFYRASPLVGWVPCVIVPTACVKVGGLVVSKRKLEAVEAKAVAHVAPELDTLAQRQADLHTQQKLERLPADLEACWQQGTPLEGTGPLPDPASRRQHLLAYWASRTNSPWGRQVGDMVAGFLEQVVQASEHPVTAAELDAINRDRDPERQLALPLP